MSIENKIEKNIDLTKEELIEAKKILNEEGPVEGPSKNSLGAVVVGSEGEEISDLTKKIFDKFNKLENKENTKDLKTWLESHKEIELLKDDPEMISAMKKVDEILELFKKEKKEPPQKNSKKFNFFNKKESNKPKSSDDKLELKGLLLRNYSDTTNSFIGFREANVRYFDSLGNIADCHINFEKIDEYKELSGTTEGQEKMIKELGNLGFWGTPKREGYPDAINIVGKAPSIFTEQYDYKQNQPGSTLAGLSSSITKIIDKALKDKKERLENEIEKNKNKEFNP